MSRMAVPLFDTKTPLAPLRDALAARLVAGGLLLDADRPTLRERAAAEWAAAPRGA